MAEEQTFSIHLALIVKLCTYLVLAILEIM